MAVLDTLHPAFDPAFPALDRGPESTGLDGTWRTDTDETLLDGCLWCDGGCDCRHQVAEVVEGRVALRGHLAHLETTLEQALTRLAAAIVHDAPRPVVFRDLPGGDRLVAAIEADWLAWRPNSDRDSTADLEHWALVLGDRLRDLVPDWLYGEFCALSGHTLHRVEGGAGIERWMATEPAWLAADVENALQGIATEAPFAEDPLRRARGVHVA